MDPTAGGALRTARALLVAATALASAAGAHLAAGGALPGPGTAAALLAVTTVAALPMSGGRTFRVRVLAPVGALLQVVLHHAFTLLHTAAPPAAPTHHAAGAAVRTAVARTDPASPGGHGDPVALGHGDLPMLVAHAAAALATALVLVATDRAARAAATWLSRVVPLLTRPGPASWEPPRSLPVGGPLVAAHSGAALGSAARRRGPPVVVRPGP